MSFRQSIPWRVALQQSPPPLPLPCSSSTENHPFANGISANRNRPLRTVSHLLTQASTVGNPWGAFETPVTAAGMNNSYVYQENAGNPNVNAVTLHTYEEETYLYLQIIAALLPKDRIAIQEAAWSITDPAFNISNNREAQLWKASAMDPTNYLHVNLSGIVIYSGVTGIHGGQQEFIAIPSMPSQSRPR